MSTYNRQNHLKELHRQRKEATHTKAESAIMRLIKSNKAVNFNSVAAESGLSKATLYSNADLRESIEKLRFRQSQAPTPAAVRLEMSEQSKDAIIASLRRKIQVLQEENQQLKNQVELNYAELYEKL